MLYEINKNRTTQRLSLPLLPLMIGLLMVAPHFSFAQQPRTGGGFSATTSSSSTSTQTSTDGSRTLGTAIIQYDSETGSIIIIADDETNDRIKSVLDNIDRPTPQVLIKVLFLEVTHSNDKDLGVEYTLRDLGGSATDINGNAVTQFKELSTAFGLANETRGGFYKILDGDLAATIRAIANNNKLEVLSRPSILARNNQEATITVGQEVPFITNSRVTSDGQTINTIQYSDIGIILRVKPRIMPDRNVEMQVLPEISNLTAETVPVSDTVNARVIAKRSAETTVVVADGKTVVIGGMMENNNTEKVTKVPLLGDIPWVGALFRRTTTTKVKTELLIFLTPLVVEGPDQLQTVSNAENANGRLPAKVFSQEEMDQFLNKPPDMTRIPENTNQLPGNINQLPETIHQLQEKQ